MKDNDEAYYRYLQTSEIGHNAAYAHKEIVAKYFWDIFNRYQCKNIVDVGCGLGFFIGKAGLGINTVGIDSNVYAVKHCVKNGNKAIIGNATELPIHGNAVDGLICSHLLEHLAEPEKAFSEFHRVLQRGGVVIARVPLFDTSFYDDWTHIRPLTKKALIRLAGMCGFSGIQVFSYHYDLPFQHWQNPFYRLLNFIRHLPIIRQAANFTIKRLLGLPPNELVLIAIKIP